MKRPLFLTLICLGALAITSASFSKASADASAAEGAFKPSTFKLSMRELTSAEMYRYGREMFLAGKDAEAAQVFLNILRLDCSNKIAQYHLRKIAARTPALAFLDKKLDQLPCKSYDFSKEDLLPASMYYEKDPDLMLEQLISDRNRHRLSEQEMAARIEQYSAMVKELEGTVSLLKDNAAKHGEGTSPAAIDQATLDRLEEGRKTAGKIEKELSLLKNQMASQRLDYQKEVQDIRTGLAEAEATAPAYAQNGTALVNAMAQAKTLLENKEQALAEKDRTLAPLQERFNDIQSRLKMIQANLQNIQRP